MFAVQSHEASRAAGKGANEAAERLRGTTNTSQRNDGVWALALM